MSQPPPDSRFVLPETRALAVLGCFDLLATIFLIASHRAQEGNALMSSVMERFGPAGLSLVKALLLAIPLIIAEAARKRSPIFVPRALRIGLVAYVLLLLFAYKDPLLALINGVGHAPPTQSSARQSTDTP